MYFDGRDSDFLESYVAISFILNSLDMSDQIDDPVIKSFFNEIDKTLYNMQNYLDSTYKDWDSEIKQTKKNIIPQLKKVIVF